jgi:hypothetical protein
VYGMMTGEGLKQADSVCQGDEDVIDLKPIYSDGEAGTFQKNSSMPTFPCIIKNVPHSPTLPQIRSNNSRLKNAIMHLPWICRPHSNSINTAKVALRTSSSPGAPLQNHILRVDGAEPVDMNSCVIASIQRGTLLAVRGAHGS